MGVNMFDFQELIAYLRKIKWDWKNKKDEIQMFSEYEVWVGRNMKEKPNTITKELDFSKVFIEHNGKKISLEKIFGGKIK